MKMTRLHYAGYPARVALSVVLDRARTYLLRARLYKQRYEQAKLMHQALKCDKSFDDMSTYRFHAMLSRAQAKNMLIEAEFMAKDPRTYVPPTARGASDLDGANFRHWPQYPCECPPEKDIWSRRNGNA